MSRPPGPGEPSTGGVPGAEDCPCPPSAGRSGDGDTPPDRIVHLYVCRGLSTYRIAALVGWNRQRVTRALHAAGVAVRGRGAGRARPLRSTDDPDDLREQLEKLYVGERLTSAQVAARLGLPERRVRDRLHRYGLATRNRGRYDRDDRRTVDAATLEALYLRDGLSAVETGRLLGVSRHVVLRAAHDLGLPVRAGGPPDTQAGAGEIELINALYADPLVTRARARHRIPAVEPGGTIAERFPTPVPLTAALLRDLYDVCGLASTHIELLTGNPSETVRRLLDRHEIPRRPPGGRSPFRRRRRAATGPRPTDERGAS